MGVFKTRLYCLLVIGLTYVPDVCDENEFLSDNASSTSKRKFLNCGQNDAVDSFKEFVVIKMMSKDHSKVSKYCGGSVINDLLILTTMSCVIEESELNVLDHILRRKEMDHSRITVYSRVTQNDSLSEAEVLKVHSIVCHPNAFPSLILNGVRDYDVCLIRLTNRLRLEGSNRVSTVCLLSSVSNSKDIVYSEATGISFILKPAESNLSNSTVEFIKVHGKVLPQTDCGVISERSNCFQNYDADRLSHGSPVMGVLKSGFLAQIGAVSYLSVEDDNGEYQYCNMHEVFTNLVSKEIQAFINEESSLVRANWCTYKRVTNKLKKAGIVPSANPPTTNFCWDKLPENYFVRRMSSCSMNKRQCGIPQPFPRQRIVGGNQAIPYEYQWPAQLLITKIDSENQKITEGCGGTVINSKFIMTAAHCVAGMTCESLVPPKDIIVKLKKYSGYQHNINVEGIPVKVSRVYCHPEFSHEKVEVDGQTYQAPRNDIALLELEKHIDFDEGTEILPICLIEKNYLSTGLENKSANVVGWGIRNKTRNESLSTTLEELQVTIVDRKVCETTLKGLGFQFPDKVICAGNFKTFEEYQDPFHGDSGGSLSVRIPFVTDVDKFFLAQVGIVSAGSFSVTNNPKPTDIPVVWYVNIGEYLPFIEYLSHKAEAVWCKEP